MSENRGRVALAAILIVLGVLLFFGQFAGRLFVRFDFWHYAWPFFIIVPGVLFFVGMFAAGKGGAGLAIPGCIVTTVGLILFYQNVFSHWESWAYVWALIFPVAVGLGLMIQGLWGNQPELARQGRGMALVGAVIFLVAAAFFEGIIGISGSRHVLGRYLWPIALIAAGAVLLLRRGAIGGQARPEPPAPPVPPAPKPFDSRKED